MKNKKDYQTEKHKCYNYMGYKVLGKQKKSSGNVKFFLTTFQVARCVVFFDNSHGGNGVAHTLRPNASFGETRNTPMNTIMPIASENLSNKMSSVLSKK
jgi:hypothetical protein